MQDTTGTPQRKQPTTMTVVIDRVRWGNEEATIFLGHDESAPFVPMTVKMQDAGSVGERWVVGGKWVTHPVHGTQFEASFAARATPRNEQELGAFLDALAWPWRVCDQVVSYLHTAAERYDDAVSEEVC